MNRRVISGSSPTLEPLGQLLTRGLWGSGTVCVCTQVPLLLVSLTADLQPLSLVLSFPLPLSGNNYGT